MCEATEQDRVGQSCVCRRCGGAFLTAAGEVSLPCCPHCGVAVRPLRRMLRHNGLSAVLAVAAAIVLTLALWMPFVGMEQFGVFRSYSLLGGILELFKRGYYFIGGILLVFSVVFPYAKLAAILVATSSLIDLSDTTRRRLHAAAHLTGRYSLLDLLVVAVMIVVIRFEQLLEVRAMSGTVLFGVAVLLSIAAGLCVDLRSSERPT